MNDGLTELAARIGHGQPAAPPTPPAAGDANGKPTGAPEVTVDAKGKLLLPPAPAVDDVAGQCAWLTAVFNLSPAHPITGGERQGIAGPDGHAELKRAGAPAIRLEPLKVVNTPARLIETEATRGPRRVCQPEHPPSQRVSGRLGWKVPSSQRRG